MRYALDVSHVVRRQRNLFFTTCTIYFTEEEKAVIRERNMGGYSLLFKKGYVNYPEIAEEPIYEDISIILYIVAGASLVVFLLVPNLFFLIVPGFAIWLAIRNDAIRTAVTQSQRETVTLSEIVQNGSFSVCAFDDLFKSKAVNQEMHEQMDRLKALLNIGAEETDTLWRTI